MPDLGPRTRNRTNREPQNIQGKMKLQRYKTEKNRENPSSPAQIESFCTLKLFDSNI
jgi:hypothetical protein